MYANVRGLRGKLNGLIEILHENNPQVFLFTETQLKSNFGTTIKGYTFYSRVRTEGSGGGVGILVRNDIIKHVAPHISDRKIELMWISIRRKDQRPVYVGTYYGKQESRSSKEEIEREMNILQEEIMEMSHEGEIFICMDGNAKLGLLGETPSRNGKLLKRVFENTNLTLMNSSIKCTGKVTRKNTNNENEISAIDFVVASEMIERCIEKVVIDEDGLATIKGKKTSDHNTIISTIKIGNIDKSRVVKRTVWNLKASSEKWSQFTDELALKQNITKDIIQCQELPFNERYKHWYKEIDSTARKTIGKSTVKVGAKQKFSKEVEELNQKKRLLKKEIVNQLDKTMKNELIAKFRLIQSDIHEKMISEKTLDIEQRLKRVVSDSSRNSFWKEKKRLTQNPVLESLIIKNEHGQRIFNPDEVKKGTAKYYQELYRKKDVPGHPYHQQIKKNMIQFTEDRQHENLAFNMTPSIEEISQIITGKKNGKSTTDFRNEMIKRPGTVMVNIIYPMIKTAWEEEKIPVDWNKGQITSLWKGKGDKEELKNHRGITVSSAFGSIMEEVIDRRISDTVSLTQAQGGGKKHSSTCDHLFLLRSVIAVSLKKKKDTFITFYDVSKAYDTLDNEDTLSIMWDKGLKGKVWRILKELSTDLKANIKTRYGITEEINMDIGGRQGSRLTGRMFAKMMDLLAEEILLSGEGVNLDEDFIIGILLWVDDVVSCVEGHENQEKILERIAEFAVKHKLKWGQQKCKVMQIGKNKTELKWNLGDIKIENCDSYTYLGDVISSDGKNTLNIQSRRNKINISSCSISTIASSDVLHRIETPVLLELHEKVNISALITNSESWTLLKCEQKEIEKSEIQCLKHLFDLPVRTPTAAIIYTLGTLITSIRVDQKRLIYLHRILNRDPLHWTRKTLSTLEKHNIGWHKGIIHTLSDYNLPSDYEEIRRQQPNEWKNNVKTAIENKNKLRLMEDCQTKIDEQYVTKTKTSTILDKLHDPTYIRNPVKEIMHLSKHETKILIIARYGMLECGKNFKGTLDVNCNTCNCIDDEEHRMNVCTKYSNVNHSLDPEVFSFDNIYSNDVDIIRMIIGRIEKTWNVKTGHGTMHTDH